MPFTVRRQKQIDEELGQMAVPVGFQQIPVYNYMDEMHKSHVDSDGCQYVSDGVDQLSKLNLPFKKHLDLVEDLKVPVGEAFDLSKKEVQNMTYSELVGYADSLVDKDFEGLPLGYDFSDL